MNVSPMKAAVGRAARVKLAANRSGAKLGLLDYVLTAVGSMLAVYSAGMSIETPEIGLFCSVLILVGTAISYAVRALAGHSKFARADGLLYAIAAIVAIVCLQSLMELMPGGGFPISMGAAGGLCWMLIFGSFLSWGDRTLMFQAVPGIALFGLVGCYDTFRNVTFAFFGFLICLCTAFARAHGRDMLRRAAESGYFDRAGIPFDHTAPEQSAELFDAIRKGPWRWVAGPEWALASALAIVIISLLGAPVIQLSVQGVAGFVSIKLPNTKRNLPVSPSLNQDLGATTLIGQGPVIGFTGQAIYEYRMDDVRYLRLHTFAVYTGKGWTGSPGQTSDSQRDLSEFTLSELKDPVPVDFEVSPRVVTRAFALPGEFDYTDITSAHMVVTEDGTYMSPDNVDIGHFVTGNSLEARDSGIGVTTISPTPPVLLPFTDTNSGDPTVLQLARTTAEGKATAKEKADALMRAIVARAKYNANVPPTPPGVDPVAYFLFTSHQGYCDLFASSMVIMAREVGIPARYVTGYLPDKELSMRATYVVRDKDYHAWAELFFKDVGWVVYDPTTLSTLAEGGEIHVKVPGEVNTEALLWILNLGIAATILGGGWFLWTSRKRPAKNEEGWKNEVASSYISFARMMRKYTGRRRLLSETPREYLSQTRFALNGSYEKAADITKKFELALYAPGQIDEAAVAELRAELRELRGMLRAEKRHKKDPVPREELAKSQ